MAFLNASVHFGKELMSFLEISDLGTTFDLSIALINFIIEVQSFLFTSSFENNPEIFYEIKSLRIFWSFKKCYFLDLRIFLCVPRNMAQIQILQENFLTFSLNFLLCIHFFRISVFLRIQYACN